MTHEHQTGHVIEHDKETTMSHTFLKRCMKRHRSQMNEPATS